MTVVYGSEPEGQNTGLHSDSANAVRADTLWAKRLEFQGMRRPGSFFFLAFQLHNPFSPIQTPVLSPETSADGCLQQKGSYPLSKERL